MAVEIWRWQYFALTNIPPTLYLDTGYLHVQLFVWNNGCMDSLTRKNYVYSKPPVARFDIASIDCGNRLSRQFLDKSVAATAWFWEFGDGQTSTARNPRHTFSRPGTYLVKLTVKNATCEHWKWESVTVVDEKADLRISETELCKNVSTTIAAINSNEANIALYSWTITKGNKVYGTLRAKPSNLLSPMRANMISG